MARLTELLERFSRKRWFFPALGGAALLAVVLLVGAFTVGGGAVKRGPVSDFVSAVPSTTAPPLPPGIDPRMVDPANGKKFSQLFLRLFEAYGKGGQAAAEQEAKDLGLLDEDGIHAVLVLSKPYDDEIGDRLKKAGVTIDGYSGDMVEVTFPMDRLLEVSQSRDTTFVAGLLKMDEIVDIQAPRRPTRSLPEPTKAELQAISQRPTAIGAGPTEGIARTGANKWHAAGLTGKGVSVGIVDSFAGHVELKGAQLPADLVAKDFTGKGFKKASQIANLSEPHGTACAQIVHEMAPDAKLFLAQADSAVQFLQAMDWLVDSGVSVISLSIGWDAFPWDGTSPMSKKVDEVRAKGILVVTAAGNEADNTYVLKTTGQPGQVTLSGKEGARLEVHRFGKTGGEATLTWANPASEFKFGILDSTGETPLGPVAQRSKPNDIAILDMPFPKQTSERFFLIVEQVSGPATTIRIHLSSAAMNPALRSAWSSIIEPAAAKGSFAVAAAEVATDRITTYSSWGPTMDGRWKPEISGPSHVSSFYYKSQPQGFNGTSAATPHVAGAAALVKGRFPNFKGDDIKKFLMDNAVDLAADSARGVYVGGVGRLNLPDPSTLR